MVKRLDIGCGKTKQDGWVGMDIRNFPGVDFVINAGADRWPFEDGTIDEARASHFVEHLKPAERIHFVNELHRVLVKDGKCQIITPHWCSNRAYGDLTHEWPPVSEMWFYYLRREWREVNAPHNDAYTCDFSATWGYSFGPELGSRHPEHQQYALTNFKDAAQDIVATVVKL